MGKSVFVCELFFRISAWNLAGRRSRRAEQRYKGHFFNISTLDGVIHSRKSGKNGGTSHCSPYNFWTARPIWKKYSAAPPPNICLQNGMIPIQIDSASRVEIETYDFLPRSKNFNFCILCWEWIKFVSGKVDMNMGQNILLSYTAILSYTVISYTATAMLSYTAINIPTFISYCYRFMVEVRTDRDRKATNFTFSTTFAH